jgi:hypothetical protein
MGIATVGTFTSPFTAIGILAPGLAILFREVGPNTAYLLQTTPPSRRGPYISFQYVTQERSPHMGSFVSPEQDCLIIEFSVGNTLL